MKWFPNPRNKWFGGRHSASIENIWESVGGDVSIYNMLRDKWISGMLENSGLEYYSADGLYYIQREAV